MYRTRNQKQLTSKWSGKEKFWGGFENQSALQLRWRQAADCSRGGFQQPETQFFSLLSTFPVLMLCLACRVFWSFWLPFHHKITYDMFLLFGSLCMSAQHTVCCAHMYVSYGRLWQSLVPRVNTSLLRSLCYFNPLASLWPKIGGTTVLSPCTFLFFATPFGKFRGLEEYCRLPEWGEVAPKPKLNLM